MKGLQLYISRAGQPGSLPMRATRSETRCRISTDKAGKDIGHVRLLLGAYVLGGLSLGEELSVRAHLRRCAQCRAEYDELADFPGLLDLLGDLTGEAEPRGPARPPSARNQPWR
jgi:anti-sigma factor RsiW